MSRPTTLQMPQTNTPNGSINQLTELDGSVVIVGANGAGKTRLGVWFEFQGEQQTVVRRIGAQKSLTFPESVSPSSLQDAIGAFDIGIDLPIFIGNRDALMQSPSTNRRYHKWGQKPETMMVDDYSKLLVLLISEQYEVSLNYTQTAKNQSTYNAPPDTKIDRIKRIWEQVFPHRELILKASAVGVRSRNTLAGGEYQASSMSDGERVGFYLIGQCLAVPIDSIIIIDEPELHLHRVIQAHLWDAIERERPDCLFVYLTHDLEFAASHTEARKVWIESYNGTTWSWQEIPSETEGMPEEVLLAVLGSRKPVLFTEGNRSSFDSTLFSRVYPDWTIMPCGGCEQVIEATKAFAALKHLHGIDCRGIIDRDNRSDDEVAKLLLKGIHVLEIQEIEHLLLVEPVIQAVAEHASANFMVAATVAEIVSEVKKYAIKSLKKDQVALASNKTAWAIEKQLHKIDAKAKGVDELERAVASAAGINVADIYKTFDQTISQILTVEDYDGLLRLYNNKGLVQEVGRFFGTKNYPELVKRLISGGKGEPIIQALRMTCPTLLLTPSTSYTTVFSRQPSRTNS